MFYNSFSEVFKVSDVIMLNVEFFENLTMEFDKISKFQKSQKFLKLKN
jgi:hypothetical protein